MFDRHKECAGEVFLILPPEIDTVAFLSFPTHENLKDCGQHNVGLYLEN